MNQSAVVFPFHDPDGIYFPHVQAITPALKQLFAEAHLGVSAITRTRYPERVAALENDAFFRLYMVEDDLSVGEQFHANYSDAAQTYAPKTVLHLAYIDRLALAIETDYQVQFMAEMQALDVSKLPLVYQRSAKAWATHPRNYIDIEGYVTTVGEHVLGKSLDFAWCYMALTAGQLAQALTNAHGEGISMVAEILLALLDKVHTQDVDWLAWEDPFILQRDAAELKAERESSLSEVQKRLSYTLPMVDCIVAYQQQKQNG